MEALQEALCLLLVTQMGKDDIKIEDESKHLRCAKCKKVLAKRFSDGHFEIKCSRCDTINVVSEDGVVKKI